jgi:2-isopropylmalate synthase
MVLRDGEQSPAAPCTTRKNSAWPTKSQPSAVDASRPDSPSPPTATSRQSEPSPARSAAHPHPSLARCKREDIEAAARAVEAAPSNRIHLILASSDLQLECKLRITRDQAAESVRLARLLLSELFGVVFQKYLA